MTPPTPSEAAGRAGLSPDELAVLMQMSGDLGYSAAEISANLAFDQPDDGWTPRKVTTIHRALHAKGYAHLDFLMSEDDGLLRGRGYWLSNEGCAIRYGSRT